MTEYAINPQQPGQVMAYDNGPAWTPVPKEDVHINPSTGETAVWTGAAWKVLPSPSGGFAADVVRNAATGLAKGARDIAAAPNVMLNLYASGADKIRQMNPAMAQPPTAGSNSPDIGLLPDTSWMYTPQATGAARTVANALPSPEGMNKLLFKNLGLPYYVPSTALGRLGQAGLEGAGAGAIGGPWSAALGATSGLAQQGAAEAGLPPSVQIMAGLGLPLLAGSAVGAVKAGAHGVSNAIAPMIAGPESRWAKRTAATILQDEAGGPYAGAITPPPVSGTPETLGQSTNNPQILALEHVMNRRSPTAQGQFKTMSSNANQAVVGELGRLGNIPTVGENTTQAEIASATMRAELMTARDAARKVEGVAWDNVDPNNVMRMPATTVQNGLTTLRRVLGPAREDLLPGYIDTVTRKWGPTVSLNDLKDLRSRILADARRARSGPQPDVNTANVLDQTASMLLRHMENLSATNPEQEAALKAARAASRDFHETWDHPALQAVTAQTTGGFDRLPTAAVAPRLIKFGGGSGESLDAYFKATGQTPEAVQAARDYVVAKMMGRAQSRGMDLQSDPFIIAGNLRKFVNDNRSLIDHPNLFTPEQRDIIYRVADQADRLARTSRAGLPGGSDTYANLMGDQFLNTLIGKGGAQGLKLAMATAGMKVAAVPGLLGGYALGRTLANTLYGRARKNVVALIDRAVTDPAFAKELSLYARNPGYGPGPYLRGYLLSLPGPVERQR